MFKRSITYVSKDDSDLEDKVIKFGDEHEFGDITWYPAQHKAVYRLDDRVSVNRSGNGLYDFIGFRPLTADQIAAARTTGKFSAN